MDEIALSTDINVLTAEINSYKQVAGQAIFEIGRRLKYVKENDLVHGEWKHFLTSINMSKSQADRFIKIFKEYDLGKLPHMGNIGFRALYEIATMSEEEREKEHVVPSTGETKTVDEMTVKELQEVKKALKDAEKKIKDADKRAEDAIAKSKEIEQQKNELGKKLIELEKMPPKIVEVEKVVETIIRDDDKEKRLEEQVVELQADKNILEKKLETSKAEMQRQKLDAEEYRKLKAEIESMTDQKAEILKQIHNVSELGAYVAKIEEMLKNDLAPLKYINAIEEVEKSEVARNALKGILTKVDMWMQELYEVLGERKIKVLEVIEHAE